LVFGSNPVVRSIDREEQPLCIHRALSRVMVLNSNPETPELGNFVLRIYHGICCSVQIPRPLKVPMYSDFITGSGRHTNPEIMYGSGFVISLFPIIKRFSRKNQARFIVLKYALRRSPRWKFVILAVTPLDTSVDLWRLATTKKFQFY
jgi:hypothetical protein